MDFFDQARRAAVDVLDAEFVSVTGRTTSAWTRPRFDPFLPAVLRTLRGTSKDPV